MQTSMEREIIEQTPLIAGLIQKYVQTYAVVVDMPMNIKNIKIIASGSSYNCGLLGKKFFELISKVDTSVEFASEFMADDYKVDPESLYFFISQSGETYDTMCAAKKVKEAGAKTYAVVNNSSSSLYDLCDYKIDILAGEEKSIAATKSFTLSVCALYLCALKIAQNKLMDVKEYIKDIPNIDKNLSILFDEIKNLDKTAEFLSKYKAFYVVGNNFNYAISKEASLKIKETTYIDVNSMPMGEFLHGHVATLNKIDTLIEIITGCASEFETKTISKIAKDYNPKSVVITDLDEDFGAKYTVSFPKFNDLLSRTLATIITIQLLALKIALKLKRNVDSPQGLSKVVTG